MRQMAWASLQKHLVGWKTLSAFVGRREDARESGGIIPMREFGKDLGLEGGSASKGAFIRDKRKNEGWGMIDTRQGKLTLGWVPSLRCFLALQPHPGFMSVKSGVFLSAPELQFELQALPVPKAACGFPF